MANEVFFKAGPEGLTAEAGDNPSGGITQPTGNIPVGLGAGIGFNPSVTGAVLKATRVSETVALGTGLTVVLLLADDVLNPSPGQSAVFGVTAAPITSGTSTYDESVLASSTEVTGTIKMPVTPGVLTLLTIAVPAANMNSLAAGSWALVRIRRLGANASDSHRGRVVLIGADVRNT